MAIARSPQDWALWLVAGQIDTQRGQLTAALDEYHRAKELNPRSPVWKTSP